MALSALAVAPGCPCARALLFPRLDSALGSHAAVLESVGFIPRLHDVAVVGQAIKQRRGHLGVTEHA